jgi:HEAT repeat protein
MRRLLGNALVSVASTVLFAAALEGVCRWRESKAPPRPTAAYITEWMDGTTGDGFFTVKSTAVGWPPWEDYNHDGVRDREHALPKPAGTRRVVFLGDSVTLGYGIEPRQAFPQVLQDRLASRGAPIEVFNISLGGWSTRQELIAYRRIARKYRPDEVLLGICLNDIPEMENNLTRPPKWLMALYRRSALVRRAIGAQDREIHSVEELFAHRDEPKVKDAFRRMFEDIRTLAVETRADGASFAVLVFPFRFQVMPEAPPPYAQDAIGAFCKQEGIPFLDLLPAIRPRGESAYYDYDHFSVTGAATVADAVLASGLITGADALTPAGDPAATATVAQLIDRLHSTTPQERAAAALALGARAESARAARPALIRLLGDADANVRWRVGEALADLGVDASCCLAALVDVLRDETGAGRGSAARLIGKIGPDAEGAVPYLVAAIRDPREEVRAQAVVTLGQIGPPARAALPALVAAFDDTAVRWQLADALGSIAPEAPEVVPVLMRGLKDESSSVRWRAASALDHVSSPGPELVAALAAATSDVSENVRLASLKALSKTKAPSLTALCVRALKDPDSRVRSKAAEVLGRAGSAATVPELEPLLQDPEPTVREIAARAIRKLKRQTDAPA